MSDLESVLKQIQETTARNATTAEKIAKDVPRVFERLERRIVALEKRVAKLEGKKPAKKKVPK